MKIKLKRKEFNGKGALVGAAIGAPFGFIAGGIHGVRKPKLETKKLLIDLKIIIEGVEKAFEEIESGRAIKIPSSYGEKLWRTSNNLLITVKKGQKLEEALLIFIDERNSFHPLGTLSELKNKQELLNNKLGELKNEPIKEKAKRFFKQAIIEALGCGILGAGFGVCSDL